MVIRFLVAVFSLLLAARGESPAAFGRRCIAALGTTPDIHHGLQAASPVAMQPPAPQTEFIPIDKLPPGDQLPSGPLLVAAYAFVWIAVMFYLWTIWRRLDRVETDMRALEQRSATGRR